MRRPVSDELRESRITSTRGSSGAPSFNASSLRTSGNAMPGASGVVFVLALVRLVGVDAFAFPQFVAVLEVEQRARGDRDGQRRRQVGRHVTPRTVR